MTRIVNHLYLAGIDEVIDEVESREHSITHILNVAEEITCDRSDEYSYLHVPITDDGQDDISLILDICADWIHNAIVNGGTIMVHCWGGVSRSACIVIAYMVKYRSMSVDTAYYVTRNKRLIIDPWRFYLDQVRRWADTQKDLLYVDDFIVKT